MAFDVRETTLPGIGKKYEIDLNERRSLAVLIRSDGHRELFSRADPDDDFERVLELTDAQARTVGLFLVGAYYQPISADVPEETEAGEHIEWYSVTEASPIAGRTVEDVDMEGRSGATILGIERDEEVLSTVSDDVVFEPGNRLIVVGSEDAHDAVRSLVTDVPDADPSGSQS